MPSRGGRRLLVHRECADGIEAQATLDVDAGAVRPRPLEPEGEIPF